MARQGFSGVRYKVMTRQGFSAARYEDMARQGFGAARYEDMVIGGGVAGVVGALRLKDSGVETCCTESQPSRRSRNSIVPYTTLGSIGARSSLCAAQFHFILKRNLTTLQKNLLYCAPWWSVHQRL